jgi:hypothetical protein
VWVAKFGSGTPLGSNVDPLNVFLARYDYDFWRARRF